MACQVKRIHDPVLEADGKRILVDRDWPADITPHEAEMNSWYKDVAPSAQLNEWYGNDPAKFDEFKTKYIAELDESPLTQAEITQIRDMCKDDTVTLLHAASDPDNNAAAVLKEYLQA